MIQLLKGVIHNPCTHQLCFQMNIDLDDVLTREAILNRKDYLGVFYDDDPPEVRAHLTGRGAHYYALWEQECTNENDTSQHLILNVSYTLPRGYNTVSYTRLQITIAPDIKYHRERGRFVILGRFKLPGDRYNWFYPVFHYPTFKTIQTLITYIHFKRHLNDLIVPLQQCEILSMVEWLKSSNRFYYRLRPDYRQVGETNKRVKLFKVHKVPSLQHLTACFIRSMSFKNRLKLYDVLPRKLVSKVLDARYLSDDDITLL